MSSKAARTLSGLVVLTLLTLAGLPFAGRGASAQPPEPQVQPRLSQLDISIWPEFDAPPAWPEMDGPPSLVIIQAELAAATALPARLTFHIPLAAGRPNAVASASSSTAELADLESFQTKPEGDSLLVTVETPDPIVHLEFYLPMAREDVRRDFTYSWPGGLAADSVTLRAQIPIGAEDFQTEPELGSPEVGQFGLLYRQGTFGPLEAAETLSLRLEYDKEGTTLSQETLPAAQPSSDDGGTPLPWPALAAIAAVGLVGIVAVAWYRYYGRRPAPARARPGGAAGAAGYCTQCGQALSTADRFCSRCGTPVRK